MSLLLAVLPGLVDAQWRGAGKRMRPHACVLADSLLGPSHTNATVLTTYNASGDSTYLQSGAFSPARLRLSGVLIFPGRGPNAHPAPTLNFAVGPSRLATALVSGATPPNLTLILDDTLVVPMGRVPVGRYTGPPQVAIAPIAVYSLPAWSLALARARKAALRIDSETLPVPEQDLREFEALYRFATCDSLPVR